VINATQLEWGEEPADAVQKKATDGMRDERFYLNPVLLRDEQQVPGPVVCPFLGLEFDRATRAQTPTPGHRCYGENRRPREITEAHQGSHCLTGQHITCKAYMERLRLAPPSPHGIRAIAGWLRTRRKRRD
jgi:hypothetical protein